MMTPWRASESRLLSLLKEHRSEMGYRVMPFPGFLLLSGRMPPSTTGRYLTFVATLMHPLSRGSVHISSADPTAPPAIDPSKLLIL